MDKRIEQIVEGFKRRLNGIETTFIARVLTNRADNLDVEDLNGTRYLEVRKIATAQKQGFILTPKEGSFVLVSRISGSDDLYVSMFSEIEKVEVISENICINEGENGGLCITPRLVEELKKLTARVDGIINAINKSAPIAGDGGASLKVGMVNELLTLVDKEDFSEIENKKITH